MKLLHFRAALLFALTVLPASAEIIGVEQFDYADGAIAGQSGGTFWDYKNTSPTGRTAVPSNWDNVIGSPAVSSGRLVTSGNGAVRREYNGNTETNGAVNGVNVAKKVFYRVDVTTGPTVTPADYFGISSMDFGTERLYFGKRGGSTTWGVEEVGVGGTNGSVTILPNTTYTLVVHVDFESDFIRLFVNPDLSGPELGGGFAVASRPYTGTNWSTAVRFAAGTAVTWDNLVIATTWKELGTVVTTLADEDNGDLAPASGGGTGVSLREALKYAPTGSLITFAPGLSGQNITLTHPDGDMEIPGTLTIDATALPGGLTVNGNNTSRHFFVGTGRSLTLRGLTLTGGNSSTNPGGAVSNDGVLNLFRCTLRGNTGTAGTMSAGGAVFSSGQLRAEDCSFIQNSSPGLGGAIFLLHGGADLIRCTLAGNTAELGGAILVQGATTADLSDCTVSGNHSSGNASGGGCMAIGGTLNLLNCTVSQNTGKGGGGIYLTTPASVHVHSSIIAGNTNPSGGPADIHRPSGTLTNSGANIIGSNAGVADSFPASPSPGIPALGSYVGTATSPLDPKLSPLGWFGGPVQTMHPLVGSLAIDTAGPTDPGGTDARGFPRFENGDPASSGSQLDIGAVEAGRISPVNSSAGDNSTGTLRSRIAAITDPGTRITFSPTIAGQTILLGGSQLDIPATPGLFIDASNLTAPVTISGSNASRVFNIPATATVAMHSLKIVNGLAPSGAPITLLNSSGGGILNKGTCSVFFSTISGNSATFIGGGIGNLGTCAVHSTTLSGNAAPFGGGGIYNNGTCTVISSTLTGHSVQIGGGIYNEGACNVISSTLSANSASNSGGGLYNNDNIGTFHLSSSIVAGNTAPNGANISNTLASNINNLTSGDPLLSPLGDYGGPTQTLPPLPGSPAIDTAGPVSEVQQVAISILPTVFTLTFSGATTGSLNQFLTASEVATALQNLSTIGSGNVTVEKTNNEVNETFFRITFIGARGGSNQPQLISNNGSAQVATVRNGSPGSSLATDQRGLRRPRDGDGNGTALPDLGAVEASLALVTTLADAGTGSLRAAVAEVAAQPGPDTIFFASALDGGTITLGNAFDITDASPVTIDATALSGGLTLSGGNANRHFTVQNGSTLKLRGLTLTKGNRSGGVGGSILNQGTLDLVRCTFTGNSAAIGGAIHTTGDSLQAHSTTFSGNTANTGGAIYVNTGDLTLTSSTLSGNTAESAAAIFKDGLGAATVTNCTVAGNHGTSGNGAIVAFTGTLDIVFSTISQNVGTGAGGGLYYKSPASVSLYASIIAGNTDTSSSVVGPDIYKGDPAAGIFLSDKNFIGTLTNSGIAPGPDILVGDPKLSPLGHFGGPVQTMHPLIGSPAIDGSPDETPGDATDARGFPGLVDGDIGSPGAQYDLGAVEAGPLFTVTSNAPSGSNTLREKIGFGATTVGARIGFATASFPAQTITLGGTELFVFANTNGLFIDASNLAAPVTISGNNATRVFNIMQGATVAMHSLKMVDGNSSADGGGILNDATLTLMSSTLNSNRSESSGGGLTNFGTCAMHDSTVSGNTTVSGGGGGIRNSGFLSVFSSTFSGNLAPSSEGGGIRNFGTCTIHSSTISGNSAPQGSGIYNADTCTLSSTIVAGNISDNFAGSYTGSSNIIGLDPLLAPLGDYGGPTQTMPPLRGSPAVDAGATTTARTDQRGGSRSRDGDGDFIALPDIGAVEAGLIPVTTTADSGAGSLRAALAEATTHPGPDTLFFTTLFIIPSVSTDITLAGEIVINDPAGVTLDASDLPTGIVIDAGPGTNRHFRIAAGTTALFHRLRLYGGNGTGAETNDIGHGGSIRNEGNLTLRECMIADCTSPTFGGAIFNTHPGTLTLERCTLHGNSANAGGGAIQQVSPNLVTLTACTIANNAGGFEAGGINAPFGPALLIHCTVSGNAVTNPGSNGVGGLRGGALTVRDSIVAGNTDANLPGIPNISPGFTAPGTNITSGDAKLAPLGDYGGPTFTAPPVPGSPAINAATGSTTDFDQRGFARNGTADLGAAEFRGAPDAGIYWLSDWDGDGQTFGIEHALGTDPLLPDRGNTRNLTAPTFDGLGRTQLTFGVNNAATPGTQWKLTRSTTLQPGSFTEIFRFDGNTYFFNNAQVGALDNGTSITVIDRFPPPGRAFYRFEAEIP